MCSKDIEKNFALYVKRILFLYITINGCTYQYDISLKNKLFILWKLSFDNVSFADAISNGKKSEKLAPILYAELRMLSFIFISLPRTFVWTS